MKLKIALLTIILTGAFACKKEKETKTENTVVEETSKNSKPTLKITPIEHASAVIEYGDETIFIDPTLGGEPYKNFNTPNYVVITDIHGDHLNIETLKAIDLTNAKIIAPAAVIGQLLEQMSINAVMMRNGENRDFKTFSLEAIPMYNLREEALKFHSKGRGNGYVFTFGDERVYFSGDTEDIPEMRALKNIDKAFVCMNLPYTMTVESAASAVIDFKPKEVFPYHFRGTEGLSDIEKFKQIVNDSLPETKVTLLDWYPKS